MTSSFLTDRIPGERFSPRFPATTKGGSIPTTRSAGFIRAFIHSFIHSFIFFPPRPIKPPNVAAASHSTRCSVASSCPGDSKSRFKIPDKMWTIQGSHLRIGRMGISQCAGCAGLFHRSQPCTSFIAPRSDLIRKMPLAANTRCSNAIKRIPLGLSIISWLIIRSGEIFNSPVTPPRNATWFFGTAWSGRT